MTLTTEERALAVQDMVSGFERGEILSGELVITIPGRADPLRVDVPDLTRLIEAASVACQLAASLIITSPESHEAGVKLQQTCRTIGRDIAELCAPMRSVLKAMNGAAQQFEKRYGDPLKEVADRLARETGAWKHREDERAALETALVQDEERRQREAQQAQQVAQLKEEGRPELAHAVAAQPIQPSSRVVPSKAKKIAKSALKTYWKWRLACGHAPDHKEPFECCRASIDRVSREYLMLHASKITALGEKDKDVAALDGIVFYPEHKTATGTL